MSDVVEKGLVSMLVPRLTDQATRELQEVLDIIQTVQLSDDPDTRECFAATRDNKLQSALVYHVLRGGEGAENGSANEFVWKNRAPPRVQFFGWLATRGRLQCRANLALKNVVPDDTCVACVRGVETSAHILFQCEFAERFWAMLRIGTPGGGPCAPLHLLQRPREIPALHFSTFVLLCCWSLWKRRNRLVFDGVLTTMPEFLASVRAEAALWRHRLKVEERRVVDSWCSILVLAN